MILKLSKLNHIVYFLTFTCINYLIAIAYIQFFPDINLLLKLLMTIIVFILMFTISSIFYGNPFKFNQLSSYFNSLIHILTLLVIGNLIPVIIIITTGTTKIYIDAKPSFVNKWHFCLPFYALIHWGFVSIMIAFFYHSITYELFSKKNKLIGIIASTFLFTINYNLPLISNYWNIWDILFFGAAFAYSYSIKKNPWALITAYLLSEVPLWWCILAPFGETVFASYFFVRFIISIIALFFYVNKFLKKEK